MKQDRESILSALDKPLSALCIRNYNYKLCAQLIRSNQLISMLARQMRRLSGPRFPTTSMAVNSKHDKYTG